MLQSIGGEPSGEPVDANWPAPRRSRRVWFAGILVTVVCLAVASLAAWKYATRQRSRLGGALIGARTMPDGTVLVLEQVTTKKPHQLTMTRPGSGSMLSAWVKGPSAASQQQFSVYPYGNNVVMWFTRWRPELPDSLDFDWWLTSALIDEQGEEILDSQEQSHVIAAAGGRSSRGADRPWAPLTRAKDDVIIATSQFPALRQTAGPRIVKVYDRDGKQVAEFDVPFPDTSTTPQWSPDPLPAIKPSDDVRVTFAEISMKEQPQLSISGVKLTRRRPHWSVTTAFSVERSGVPAPEWKAEPIRLSDALGNSASGWDCRLSVRERAWKLELTVARDAPQAFTVEEQWESPLMPLPAADSSQPVDHQATVQQVGISLIAVGRGATQYAEFASSSGGMSQRSSSPGRIGAKSFRVSHSSSSGVRGPTVHRANISGDCAHLLLKLDRLPPNHRQLFRVHDDQGRELPHEVDTLTMGDILYAFVFVDPAADAQSLRITTYLHTARTVELLISPPVKE